MPVVVVVEDVELPVPAPDGAMVELPGDVELVVVEELDGLVLVVLSVVVVEDDDGGMAGMVVDVVVLELGGVITVVLGVALGGVTTVVRSSLRSQPTTPSAMATAKVLDSRILDFMGNSFQRVGNGKRKTDGSGRPFRWIHSQVQCHIGPELPSRQIPARTVGPAHGCGASVGQSPADHLKKLLPLCNGCVESKPRAEKITNNSATNAGVPDRNGVCN